MSDLIDRQALLKQIDIDSDGEPGYYGDTWKFIDTIKNMPNVHDLTKDADTISRQAAIDALKKQREELLKGLDKNSNVYGIISASTGIVICTVGQLPSAQPTFDARDTQYNLPIGTDLISRQAAIDEIDEWIKAFRESGHKQSAADARLIQDGIIQLPSAEPEPAQWVQMLINPRMYKCSNCGVAWNKRLVFDLDNHNEMFMKYCPCCGKKMLAEVDYE